MSVSHRITKLGYADVGSGWSQLKIFYPMSALCSCTLVWWLASSTRSQWITTAKLLRHLTPSLPKYLPKQRVYTILAKKIIWTSLNLSTVNCVHAETKAPTPCKQVIVTYLLSAAVPATNSSVSCTPCIQVVLVYKGLVVKGLNQISGTISSKDTYYAKADKYQLSPINPRDGTALQTGADNQCRIGRRTPSCQ